MVPTKDQAIALWETYKLPEQKRIHVTLVARVAVWLGEQVSARGRSSFGRKSENIKINTELLEVAALLHDIDKAIPKLPGEQHPDTAVRVLREQGMMEVADIVKTHSLHSIVDPNISPKTWEEKLLYLADKMVKYEVITVDKRFALWEAEDLPEEGRIMLRRCYPLVKSLEKDIFTLLGIQPEDVAAQVANFDK